MSAEKGPLLSSGVRRQIPRPGSATPEISTGAPAPDLRARFFFSETMVGRIGFDFGRAASCGVVLAGPVRPATRRLLPPAVGFLSPQEPIMQWHSINQLFCTPNLDVIFLESFRLDDPK